MLYLLISMLIKEHNYQNTFTVLEFSIFTIFDQKIIFKKYFGKVIIIKDPAGFEFITAR